MKQISNFILEKLKIDKNTKLKNSDPNDPSTWRVGDILAGTFGATMCLPEFFKILRRTAKSFIIQRMTGKIVSGHKNGQWEEIADIDAPLIGKEITVRINKYGYVKLDGHIIYLWDGKPLYGDDQD